MPVNWYNFIWGLVWIEMSVACWDRLMWQSELFRGQKCTFRTGRPWGILREAVYQTRKQYTAEDYFFKSLYGHICIVFNSFLLFSSSIKHVESMTLAQKHFLLVISITIIEILLLMKDLPPALQNVIYISNDHSSTIQTWVCFWYIWYFFTCTLNWPTPHINWKMYTYTQACSLTSAVCGNDKRTVLVGNIF